MSFLSYPTDGVAADPAADRVPLLVERHNRLVRLLGLAGDAVRAGVGRRLADPEFAD